jgi:hypothetical protein
MRVQRISLYSDNSEIISFDMTGPDVRNPYTIKAITGLDADEIVPRYYSSGLISGNSFNELALGPREITLRIDLKPNYRLDQHPADLRAILMGAIASSREGTIQLRFIDGGKCWGAIKGFVTKFEAPLTTKDTEVQFTMKCDDPIIRSLDVTSAIIAELDVDEPLIIDPISTSPHGFRFKATFWAATGGFTWGDESEEWAFVIDYDFLTDDELYFSSEYGNKYLYRVRSAVTLQLMDKIEPGSVWPMIFPRRENQFVIAGLPINWNEFFWYETHWGV